MIGPRPDVPRTRQPIANVIWAPWRLPEIARQRGIPLCLSAGTLGAVTVAAACIAPIGSDRAAPFESVSAYLLHGTRNTVLMGVLLALMAALGWAVVSVGRLAVEADSWSDDTEASARLRAFGLAPLCLVIPAAMMWAGRLVVEARWPTVGFVGLASKPAWLEWPVFDGMASTRLLLVAMCGLACVIARAWTRTARNADTMRGHCPGCTYPLDGDRRCPECGLAQSPETAGC